MCLCVYVRASVDSYRLIHSALTHFLLKTSPTQLKQPSIYVMLLALNASELEKHAKYEAEQCLPRSNQENWAMSMT